MRNISITSLNLKSCIHILFISTVGLSSIGCGEGFQTRTNSSEGEMLSLPVDEITLQKIDDDIDTMEENISQVDTELNKIQIPNLDLGGGTPPASQKITDIEPIKKLTEILDRVFEAAKQALNKIDEVRTQLHLQLLKLDPNNPAHAELISRINELLARIDSVETKVSEALHRVGDKIVKFVTKVDDKIAKMDPQSPLTWAALIFWQDIKSTILEYKDKIVALAP